MMSKKIEVLKGVEALQFNIERYVNKILADTIKDEIEDPQIRSIILKALWKEYQEREKSTWRWKDWYLDLVTRSISKSKTTKGGE